MPQMIGALDLLTNAGIATVLGVTMVQRQRQRHRQLLRPQTLLSIVLTLRQIFRRRESQEPLALSPTLTVAGA